MADDNASIRGGVLKRTGHGTIDPLVHMTVEEFQVLAIGHRVRCVEQASDTVVGVEYSVTDLGVTRLGDGWIVVNSAYATPTYAKCFKPVVRPADTRPLALTVLDAFGGL